MWNWECKSFFFQAEDGIRDLYVTGVQTCALPICIDVDASTIEVSRSARSQDMGHPEECLGVGQQSGNRSEERRVGKECRSRRRRNHLKKKRLIKMLNNWMMKDVEVGV